MSIIKNLTVDRIEQRTLKGTGESFPFAIVSGISFSKSITGNSRFTLREISIPLNGMSLSQAKQYFPPNSRLEGYEIYKKEVDPYEYETSDGQILSLNYSWDVRKVDPNTESEHNPRSAKSSMERQVFSDSTENHMEPAL